MKVFALLAFVASICAIAFTQDCVPNYYADNFISSAENFTKVFLPDLIDPRGIAFNSTLGSGQIYIANTGSGFVTVHNSTLGEQIGAITVPGSFENTTGSPTAIYYSDSESDWAVGGSVRRWPARLIGCTLDGLIFAWSPDIPGFHNVSLAVLNNTDVNSSYTGMQFVDSDEGPRIYLADWSNGKIDVYDGRFRLVSPTRFVNNSFEDTTLPEGYSPFNVYYHNGTIFISYAQKGVNNTVLTGAGLGYINAYNISGAFLGRVLSAGALNAPYGMIMSSAEFGGPQANTLFVGNYGDGLINGFLPNNETAIPLVARDSNSNNASAFTFAMPGLYSLAMNNNTWSEAANTALYYVAGMNNGTQGVAGRIKYDSCVAEPVVPIIPIDPDAPVDPTGPREPPPEEPQPTEPEIPVTPDGPVDPQPEEPIPVPEEPVEPPPV